MTKIYQLHRLVNFFLWAAIIATLINIILVPYVMFFDASAFSLKIDGVIYRNLAPELIVTWVLGLLGQIAFIIALYHMRRVVQLFVSRDFFVDETIFLLKKIGKLLLATGVLLFLPTFLLPLVSTSHLEISLSADPGSLLFLIVIALLFFTLSYIFDEARRMKEENELTV